MQGRRNNAVGLVVCLFICMAAVVIANPSTTTRLPSPSSSHRAPVVSSSVPWKASSKKPDPTPSPAPAPPSPPSPPPKPSSSPHPEPPIGPVPDVPSGSINNGVLAGAWIPFTIVFVISLAFSFFFVKYYQHKREKDLASTIIAILALAVALLTAALVPVDIFLVSSFKGSDGLYNDWASDDVRDTIKNSVTYAYYAMYACTELFVFFLLPMAYFFFEEKDEESGTTTGQRLCSALKYTAGFLMLFGVLMCIGAFALHSGGSECSDSNETDISHAALCRAQYAENALTSSGGTNALSFTIGTLTVLGFMYFITYTASGMVYLAISMIRSRHKARTEDKLSAKTQLTVNREQRDTIRAKYQDKKKNKMSSRDQDRIFESEERERIIQKATDRLDEHENGIFSKVALVCRPFEFIFGIIFFLLGIFLVIALLLTSMDKLLQINSQGLDYKTGYTETEPNILNPVDSLMTVLQSVFPLDYIVMTCLVYYFLLSTMAGVRELDVRVCCLKMFKIRPRRTPPQGVLFICFILMFTVLALNVVLLTLAPQYVTFGNQKYPSMGLPNTTGVDAVIWPASVSPCNYQAPSYLYQVQTGNTTSTLYQINTGVFYNASKPPYYCNELATKINFNGISLKQPTICYQLETPCTQTRMAALLHAFFYNLWFFGAIYYWANWGVVLVFFVALVWITCRKRKSLVQALINDAKDDMDDSDDDMTPFNPNWK